MTISQPFCITSRLLLGVRIGDAELSISYSDSAGDSGRVRYCWHWDCEGKHYYGNDLQSGCNGGNLREGIASLLSFLGAFAESWRYRGSEGENADLFPADMATWAMANSDELGMLSFELEENPELISD